MRKATPSSLNLELETDWNFFERIAVREVINYLDSQFLECFARLGRTVARIYHPEQVQRNYGWLSILTASSLILKCGGTIVL